jgi:hypothetical protein
MGANAQTSVPAFTAGQVLTAAQMTQVNTGIPVFASSTERDAAFGGTGEKTLAEGQMAYLEDTNATQYYDGSAWAAVAGGKILQVVSTAKTDTFSTSSTSYTDITGLSVAITPSATSSKILVLVDVKVTAGNDNVNVALLRGATQIYLGDTAGSRTRAMFGSNLVNVYQVAQGGGIYLDSPATTSATTYKLQMSVSAGTGYVNRNSTDTDASPYPRTASSITVLEVSA